MRASIPERHGTGARDERMWNDVEVGCRGLGEVQEKGWLVVAKNQSERSRSYPRAILKCEIEFAILLIINTTISCGRDLFRLRIQKSWFPIL